MRAQWYPVFDEELATYTFIAPRTGDLIVTDVDIKLRPMPILIGLLLGAEKNNMDNFQFSRDTILDIPANELEMLTNTQTRFIKKFAEIAIKLLPLSMALSFVNWFFEHFSRNESPSIREALLLTANAFGRRSDQNCLLISLCRHILLTQLNIESKIILGAHIPTRKMHAWVQVGNHPILECPDVLIHYQTCVIYQ